jgi:hypothetical protein
LLASGSAIEVTGGYISVQAESHPMEIRKLEVFPLAL